MRSPITGNEMILVRVADLLPYRNDQFPILYHNFLDKETGQTFTNDELDDINLVQAHNQYREKYGIPPTEQIIKIRNKYEVSAAKMSEILGLGVNTYRLYEAGEMPSVSTGRLILSVCGPAAFLIQVEASTHLLSVREKKRITETIHKLQAQLNENIWDTLFEQKIFDHQALGEFTGFKEPKLDKISQVIAFFSAQMDLYKTKLNKLLFYADFCHYQKTGFSITGIAYRAIPFGPVPAEYQTLFVKLSDDQQIEIKQVDFGNGNFGEQIFTTQVFDSFLFTEIELQVLTTVGDTFRTKNTSEVVALSHLEIGWLENEASRSMISYQKYAFETSGVV